MGPRLRRLRRDLGLTQPGMAADLEISVSYVSLLETNQRPLTTELLLRLARTYHIDIAAFAGDGGADFTKRLQAVLKDPLFADIDLPALQTADVAANFPGFTEALLRLHTAYRAEQAALADGQTMPSEGPAIPGSVEAVAEVRRFLASRGNSFQSLDDAAEVIAADAGKLGFEAYIAVRHELKVRYVPSAEFGGMVRRYDPHHAAIFMDEGLDGPGRRFQMALQLAYLELGRELDGLVAEASFVSENARRLGRRALANYIAGAIVMPFARFAQAAEDKRYDLEALASQFGTSFEQVAHRLTTLSRPDHNAVPFFFMRVDAAGNVSKRLDGAGFPFASYGGGCPLWSVHRVFATPGRIESQLLELPDGQRFLSIARTVLSGVNAHGAWRTERAVALVCGIEHADRLVYRDDAQGQGGAFTPIGIACNLCQRDRCAARAVPPIGRQILPDDFYRTAAPMNFADD